MAEAGVCPACNTKIAADAPLGLCPKCLLEQSDLPPPSSRFSKDDDPVEKVRSAKSSGRLMAQPKTRRLGPYILTHIIGRGGMGIVWQGVDTRLNRRVALKIMRAGTGPEDEETERFQREAHSAAKLRHRNIVPIHDVGHEDGYYYLVMDFVDGVPLSLALREGALTFREKVVLLQRIAAAVAHANAMGVIHRDLKPSNIMLEFSAAGESSSGRRLPGSSGLTPAVRSYGEPVVMDFGLAKDLSKDSSLSVSGQAMGTPSYMPPEQAEGRTREIGPHSDVYGLGTVLYEMLTGRPPFTGEKVVQILQSVVNDEAVPPRRIVPSVPRDLETICLKCLEKKTDLRYRDAGELGVDLEAWLQGDPISARRLSLPERSWRAVRRYPARALGALVFVIFFTAAGSLISVKVQEVRRTEHIRQRIAFLMNDAGLDHERKVLPERALGELISLKHPVATDELIAWLASPRPAPRVLAAEALGWMDDPRAIQALLPLIAKDADAAVSTEGVQVAAMRALMILAPDDLAVYEAIRKRLWLEPGQLNSLLYWKVKPYYEPYAERLAPRLAKHRGAETENLSADDWCDQGLRHVEANQFDEAIACFSKALELNPQFSWVYNNRGRAHRARGDLSAAMADFDRSLDLDPNDAWAFSQRALVRTLKNDLPGALSDANCAIKINARDSDYFNHRAIIRLAMKDAEGARTDLQEALRLNPRNVGACVTHGQLELAAGNLAKAFTDFTKAIELNPRYAEAYKLRGDVKTGLGDDHGALNDYSTALELYPRFINALRSRAAVRKKLGDSEGAARDEKNAVEIETKTSKQPKTPVR